jgi:hypothetical protein
MLGKSTQEVKVKIKVKIYSTSLMDAPYVAFSSYSFVTRGQFHQRFLRAFLYESSFKAKM